MKNEEVIQRILAYHPWNESIRRAGAQADRRKDSGDISADEGGIFLSALSIRIKQKNAVQCTARALHILKFMTIECSQSVHSIVWRDVWKNQQFILRISGVRLAQVSWIS